MMGTVGVPLPASYFSSEWLSLISHEPLFLTWSRLSCISCSDVTTRAHWRPVQKNAPRETLWLKEECAFIARGLRTDLTELNVHQMNQVL